MIANEALHVVVNVGQLNMTQKKIMKPGQGQVYCG